MMENYLAAQKLLPEGISASLNDTWPYDEQRLAKSKRGWLSYSFLAALLTISIFFNIAFLYHNFHHLETDQRAIERSQLHCEDCCIATLYMSS